jgi:hypothetical protein
LLYWTAYETTARTKYHNGSLRVLGTPVACTIHPDDNGTPFTINQAQFDALNRKFQQDPDGSPNFISFRRRARKAHDCIMIHWCNMWLGIETDGYTHS